LDLLQIKRAFYACSFVENVRVNHRRADILVSEQFLNRADVVMIFKQVRGKAVPQRMARAAFVVSRLNNGLLDRTLQGVVA